MTDGLFNILTLTRKNRGRDPNPQSLSGTAFQCCVFANFTTLLYSDITFSTKNKKGRLIAETTFKACRDD